MGPVLTPIRELSLIWEVSLVSPFLVLILVLTQPDGSPFLATESRALRSCDRWCYCGSLHGAIPAGGEGQLSFKHHVARRSLSPTTLAPRAVTFCIPTLTEADQGSNTWHLHTTPTWWPDAVCATTQPEATYMSSWATPQHPQTVT